MANVNRDIVFRFLGDASKLQSAARQAESSLTGVADKMSAAGQKMSALGTTMTRNVTLPLVALGGFAFKAASDTAEALNKMTVVFGDSSGAIDAWSKTTAESFGISRREALGSAGDFGNLFTAMGLGQGEAADLSVKMVELASDLGSFHNLKTDEVLTKLRAGLVGEMEPLRSLGVALNAATVNAKAMEMGLVDLEGNVTEQGKVQARFALIMEQTAAAQGDFARTSEGAANAAKIARASFDDAMAGLGDVLLPIGTRILNEFVIPLVEGFADMDEQTQTWLVGMAVGGALVGPALEGLAAVLKSAVLIAQNPFIGLLLAGVAVVAISFAFQDNLVTWWEDHMPSWAQMTPRYTGGEGTSFHGPPVASGDGWKVAGLLPEMAQQTYGPVGGYGPMQPAAGPSGQGPWAPQSATVNVNLTDWNTWDPNFKYQIGQAVWDAMQGRGQSTASGVSARFQRLGGR